MFEPWLNVSLLQCKPFTHLRGYFMKSVTLTELRRNLETYLNEAKDGDIAVTRYGKIVARLVSTERSGETESDTANGHDASSAARTGTSPVA